MRILISSKILYKIYGQVLIFILFAIPIFPEDLLLRKPWTKNVITNEQNSYHTLVNSNKTNPIVKREDSNHHQYEQNTNGKINFELDENFNEGFPEYEQREVHFAEANSLIQNKNHLMAIRLLKGLNLCFKLKNTNSIVPNREHSENNSILNNLLNQYSDKKEEISSLTDPYGCILTDGDKKSLHIESAQIGFKLKIDPNLNYIFPYELNKIINEDRYYIWKINHFGKSLYEIGTYPDELTKELYKQQNKILKLPKVNISFIIFSLNKKTSTFSDWNECKKVLDAKRGFVPQFKDRIKFKSNQKENTFENSFENVDITAKITVWNSMEYYQSNRNRCVLLVYNFPASMAKENLELWNESIKSFQLK